VAGAFIMKGAFLGGGNLGRLHRPSADLLCRQSTARLHRPDADRDERRRRRLRRHPAIQPGDEGQGTRSAAHLGGGIVRRVTTKFNLRLGKELAHSVVRLVTPFRMPCCKLAV
jgi:hypothetical protein